jgi:putative MATE family efflux protein
MKNDPSGFLPTMLRLAVPYAAQQLVFSALGLVEVGMLGQLGETAVAATGLAKQITFLLSLFQFGLSSGAAVFTAQFWGRGDLKGIHRVMGISLLLSLTVSLFFSLGATLFPQTVLGVYSGDPAVVALGSDYLWIVGLSYAASAIVYTYGAALRSVGNVRLPVAVSIVALGVNILLDYALLFGRWGLPALGVEGVAIATCIARFLECVLLLLGVYGLRTPVAVRFAGTFSWGRGFLKSFFHTTLPVLFTEMLWSLGVTAYNLVYARIGTDAYAAFSICSTIEGVAFVPFLGLANACAIMIGNKIGADRDGEAMADARRFLLIGAIGAVVTGTAMVLTRDVVLSFFRISASAYQDARNILLVLAVAQVAKMINLTGLLGVLRSGGDTRVGFLIDVGAMWGIGVPLAVVGAFLLRLPVHWVVALAMADEVTKSLVTVPRVLSRKWIHHVGEG